MISCSAIKVFTDLLCHEYRLLAFLKNREIFFVFFEGCILHTSKFQAFLFQSSYFNIFDNRFG
jgi:hypothetical protein